MMKLSVLYAARSAANLADCPVETKALQAAITHVLRKTGNEHPDGGFGSDGRWRPSSIEAEIYEAFIPDARSNRSAFHVCCGVRHCAALFAADVALTVKYAGALLEDDCHKHPEALLTLPRKVAGKLIIDAMTNR